MCSIIVVAKDIGAANVTLPVAEELAKTFLIYSQLEGRAKDEYRTRAAFPQGVLLAMDKYVEALTLLQPAAVVTGASFPKSALERGYALAANKLSIPLVVVEDFWGGASRLDAIPDIVGAVDEAGVAVARNRYPKATVVLSGNPGVRPVPLIPPPEVSAKVQELRSRFGKVLVLLLGIEYDVAEFFAECAKRTAGGWCVVPRIHPKLAGGQMPHNQGSYADYFREVLRTLDPLVQTVGSGTTDEIAVASDGVLSGMSTTLLTATQAHVPAVSLWTPVTAQAVDDSSGGLRKHPLEEKGFVVIREPQNLFDVLRPPQQELKTALRPYDPTPLIAALRTHVAHN